MSSDSKPAAVSVGCWVTINDPDIGEETVHLVNEGQERPEQGRFAPNSAFAQALIGAKPGEKVAYTVPNGGTEQVEVLDFGRDS